MKYRDHRGSLEDSLKTTFEFNTAQDIIDHLDKSFARFGIAISDIKIQHVGFDERINEDTYYVLAKLPGKGYCVQGMCDGVIPGVEVLTEGEYQKVLKGPSYKEMLERCKSDE